MERIILRHAFLPSVCIFLFFIGIVFLIFFLISKRKWKNTVEQTSYKLRSLHEYNDLWMFRNIKEKYIYRKEFTSEAQFEAYNPDYLFSSVISDHVEEFITQLSLIQENEVLFNAYISGLRDQIIETPIKKVRQYHVPQRDYYRIEQELYESHLLSEPQGFNVEIQLQYKGEEKTKVYSYTEVQSRINQYFEFKVKRTSTKLQNLSRLNYKTDSRRALVQEHFGYTKNCKTAAEFKSYAYSDLFMREVIKDNYDLFSRTVTAVKKNEATYKAYLQAYHALRRTDSRIVQQTGLPEKVYYSLEDRLCEQNKKQIFGNTFDCYIDVYYTSPKGRNSLHYDYCYSYTAVESIFQKVRQEWIKEKQYQQSKEYERSRMTNSLRYDVMKRDGFRCVLCGASQVDGAKLHVDHIKPVAKGGKTEMSNLRTLCDRCNSGKRDKYDPLGVN